MKKFLLVVTMLVGFLFVSNTTVEAHEHEEYQLISGQTVEVEGYAATFYAEDNQEEVLSISKETVQQLIFESSRPNARFLGGTVVTPHRHPGVIGPFRAAYAGTMVIAGRSHRIYVCGERTPCSYNEYVRI